MPLRSVLIQVVVGMLLLVQLVPVLGAARRACELGAAHECEGHAHQPWAVLISGKDHGHRHTERCDHGVAAAEMQQGEPRCCGCAHVHLAGGQMPSSRERGNGEGVQLPAPAVLPSVAPEGDWGALLRVGWARRCAAPRHPPPVGLRTTRLLI